MRSFQHFYYFVPFAYTWLQLPGHAKTWMWQAAREIHISVMTNSWQSSLVPLRATNAVSHLNATVPPSTPAATTEATYEYKNTVNEKEDKGEHVLQHRVNGSVDFYQNFNSYDNGFGSLHGEFWLGRGLRYLSEMTSRRNNTLRVDLQAPDGSRIYDVYEGFSVGPVHQNLLAYHSGHPFTTYDQLRGNHCAVVSHGGWWYYNCYTANLNGHYFVPGTSNNTAMEYSSLAYSISLKESKIMFR
ncbi:FCN3-like protein [Mya arenaria]|uniref:FCN3-like protein n=1 Tax=Mya arenaria TaxID=6604 RepID=A0ABY7G669_MYAAR|nr:FCN3-like protein [Mya arenaria]